MEICARSGYQLGKSPLLPLLAAYLGAGPELIGLTVSISTMTGMVTKPVIGRLSDIIGRRPLLWLGSILFAFMPLFYLFIESGTQLLCVRVIHGLATAIYGPVIAVTISDIYRERSRARLRYGIYESVRGVGYVIGPLIGGLALTYLNDIRQAYLASSILGILSMGPLLLLTISQLTTGKAEKDKHSTVEKNTRKQNLFNGISLKTLHVVCTQLGVQLSMCAHVITRLARNFWPVAVVAIHSPASIGIVIALMTFSGLCAGSLSGMLANHIGEKKTLFTASCLLACGVIMLFNSGSIIIHACGAIIVGIGEGLISPTAYTSVVFNVSVERRGEALGFLGALKNVGKVVGPLLGGVLIGATSPSIAATVLVLPFLIVLCYHAVGKRVIGKRLDPV